MGERREAIASTADAAVEEAWSLHRGVHFCWSASAASDALMTSRAWRNARGVPAAPNAGGFG